MWYDDDWYAESDGIVDLNSILKDYDNAPLKYSDEPYDLEDVYATEDEFFDHIDELYNYYDEGYPEE